MVAGTIGGAPLQVGTYIRVVEGNVLGGYKKGHTGKVVSVLRNSFTGEILYRCDMHSPDKVYTLILLPSEIEPLLIDQLVQTLNPCPVFS
jgi:hypothetical protein